MIKKLMTACGILFVFISPAFAATFYVAPMVVWDSFYVKPIRYEGLSPKISLGVAPTLQASFKLALEAWVDPIRPYTHTNHTHHIASLKPNYSYGGSLLPGYNLDDYLSIFLRLGVLATKFKDLGDTRTAWQAGAGIDVGMGCPSPFAIRGEWDFSQYRSISGIGTVTDSQFSAGIVYHFI